MWMPDEPPTLLRLLTPHLDGTSVIPAGALLSLALYLLGVRSLRRRGMRWAWYRTASFATGVGTLVLVTATGVMGYGMMLFSVHMFQKMTVSVVSAMLLMLGAPIALAIRALPHHGAGALGRRVLLWALRSPTVGFLAHPIVATTIFVGSLYGIYFTPLFDALMHSTAGNIAMLMLFLGTGLLAFGGAFALGPWPHRVSPPMRVAELAVPGPLHAFFAVAVMTASTPLVQTYSAPPASWGIDPMTDQLAAGNLVWGFGEAPSVIAFLVVFVQWIHSDERRAKDVDRHAEADLDAYNAELARLARRPLP